VLLRRAGRLDMNALQLEHADLGRRAARRGKTTNLAAGRQDPVAGMISATGFLAMASPTSRAASGPAL
jgi:hypothetical protein